MAGIQEDIRDELVLVGVTSKVIATFIVTQKKRNSILVRNTSPNAADIITIGRGNTRPAKNNEGIVLRQFESFSDSTDAGSDAYQGQYNAICVTANGKLSITER